MQDYQKPNWKDMGVILAFLAVVSGTLRCFGVPWDIAIGAAILVGLVVG